MKTGIFTPIFFLANKELLLRVDSKTVIGRSKGNIILEDDALLSTVHCELSPMLMEIHIKDLNSTNGVYVNRQKIAPDMDFKLNVGDVIRIGSTEYILFDKEEEAKKLLPKVERRKHPRPRNLYGPENLLTFYSAPYLFRGIYLVAILLTLASYLMNLQIEVPVPEGLHFLSSLYDNQIVFSGIKLIFLVWLISLIHSFIMTIYLNRNPLRKTVSLGIYLFAIAYMVDFKSGPLWGIKGYIVERDSIEKLETQNRAIVHLKNLVQQKDDITKSYEFVYKKLSEPEQKLLENDYKKLLVKIDREIRNLNQESKSVASRKR